MLANSAAVSASGKSRALSAQKNAVPLFVGPGLRGGRWPEAHVERDGERCYFGRGWVLPASIAGNIGEFGRDRCRHFLFLVMFTRLGCQRFAGG
jgi:hypothetical protein